MDFSYVLLPEAQAEYEDSLRWYMERSSETAQKSVLTVDHTLLLITEHLYRWKIAYRHFRN